MFLRNQQSGYISLVLNMSQDKQWGPISCFAHQPSPGGSRLALQVCGGVVQRQQDLHSGELGGGRRGGAAVIVQGHPGHRAAALALCRQQQGSSTRILRGNLGKTERFAFRTCFFFFYSRFEVGAEKGVNTSFGPDT